MAEGFARTYALAGSIFSSAGTWPSREIDPRATLVMDEIGIDISSQKTKLLLEVQKPIDIIVAVCGQAAEDCPRPPKGVAFELWDLPDPTSSEPGLDSLNLFRFVRNGIETKVKRFLEAHNILAPEGS